MTAIKKTVVPTTDEKSGKPTLKITRGENGVTESTTVQTTQQAETPKPQEEKKTPTLAELKNLANIVFLLQEKHTKLSEKRASLDKFTITHERDNATATVADVNGLEFKSSSPKTIGKLIEFWKAEFDEAISEIEIELKKAFDLAA